MGISSIEKKEIIKAVCVSVSPIKILNQVLFSLPEHLGGLVKQGARPSLSIFQTKNLSFRLPSVFSPFDAWSETEIHEYTKNTNCELSVLIYFESSSWLQNPPLSSNRLDPLAAFVKYP